MIAEGFCMCGMDRQQRFMATVYAMNTLLQGKGFYSPAEFEEKFNEWRIKEVRSKP